MAINIGTKMVIQDDTVRRARESVQQTPDQRTAAGRADALQNARPGNVTPEEKEDRAKAAQEEQRKAEDVFRKRNQSAEEADSLLFQLLMQRSPI